MAGRQSQKVKIVAIYAGALTISMLSSQYLQRDAVFKAGDP